MTRSKVTVELEWREGISPDDERETFMWAEFKVYVDDWFVGAGTVAEAIVHAITHPESWTLDISSDLVREEVPFLRDEVLRQLSAWKRDEA